MSYTQSVFNLNYPTNIPYSPPPTQKADLAFGAKNQTEVLPLINKFFNDEAIEYDNIQIKDALIIFFNQILMDGSFAES